MQTKLIASILLLSGMTAFGTAALASDEVAGAIIGAGTGAIIGHSIDRHDGAVVGGVIGAVLGAAIADDDDRYYERGRDYSRPVYGPPPVVVYEAPRMRYLPPPYFMETRPVPYGWRYERHDRHDNRWDRDHDHDRWQEDRGGRHGW